MRDRPNFPFIRRLMENESDAEIEAAEHRYADLLDILLEVAKRNQESKLKEEGEELPT